MIVLAVPVVVIAVLISIFLRDDATQPESALIKLRSACSSAAMPYLKPDPRPNVEPWTAWISSQNCEARISEPVRSGANPLIGEPIGSVASVPTRLGDLTRGGPADAETPITCLARYDSVFYVPRLSLWPLTSPERAGLTVVYDSGHLRDVEPASVDFTPELHAQVSAAQRALNKSVLLLSCGAVMVVCGFGAVVWIATGWVLRPVEAIRREMADITESDLARRVPVPKGRNEIGALALSVNNTLDRLESAVENHRRFVADASHELRSPIAALRTELEIATAHPEQADWPTVVAAALTDTENLQRLATDLLLLTRLDHTASTTGNTDTVDVTTLVRRHATRRRSQHDLTTDLPDQPAPVRGSRVLLERLLGNLLDNAERHATTAVGIRLTTTNDQAILEVLDDGPGIPVEDRNRVFDRFTRLDDARTRSAGGTGLGLPIARRIATIHGGTLHSTDHPAGIGARLVAALPLAPQSRPIGSSPRAS